MYKEMLNLKVNDEVKCIVDEADFTFINLDGDLEEGATWERGFIAKVGTIDIKNGRFSLSFDNKDTLHYLNQWEKVLNG